MSQYRVMTYRIAIPEGNIGMGEIVALPDGWTPLAALRQGETALVFCSQQVGAPPASDTPVLSSLNPNTLSTGGEPASVDVLGSGFDTSCAVNADDVPRATFFIDAGHLQYTARPDLEGKGVVQITVVGDNGTSNALSFLFT